MKFRSRFFRRFSTYLFQYLAEIVGGSSLFAHLARYFEFPFGKCHVVVVNLGSFCRLDAFEHLVHVQGRYRRVQRES